MGSPRDQMTPHDGLATRRRRARAIGAALTVAATTLSLPGVAFPQPPTAERRGKPFWTALAKDCAVPPGESAFGLVSEAVSLLGSPDSRWRDDIGYGVVASCVYDRRALRAAERRALVARLVGNLRQEIGGTGTDSVLLRSFSALDLSVFAALETLDPALDAAGYRQLLEAALAYLRDEQDLRGLDPRVGWIHATAHTADLLKFLARDARFTAGDQRRLLDAAWSKLTAAGAPVFTNAEDERLAAALAAVVRRTDFDTAVLDTWLARFVELERQVWSKAPPDQATLDQAQNARNLLRSLYVLLSLPAPVRAAAPPPPSPAEAAAREKILSTLAAIRRS
jgi:hypothetical protein